MNGSNSVHLPVRDSNIPNAILTWMRLLGNALPLRSFCLFRYAFSSFQADIVCVSSSSSVRFDA